MIIIYSAVGSKYLREAMLSSKSVLKFNPNAEITIFTDQSIGKTGKNIKVVPFQVRPRPAISKVQAVIEHDAEKAIFLDTDTKIKGSLDQIWHALDQFDLAIANEPKNICGENVSLSNPKYKNLIHYNSGVFGYRKSEGFQKILNRWDAVLSEASDEDVKIGAKRNDQEVLNELIFKEHMFKQLGLRVHVLDNLIYNACGAMFKEMKRDKIYKNAIILHSRSIYHPLWLKIYHKLLSELRSRVLKY